MKGQSLIFEQVLLFMLSVAIFISCVAVFQMYQSHYMFFFLHDQASEVRDIVLSHVLQLTKFEGMDSYVKFNIPQKISGEFYEVSLDGGIAAVRTIGSNINATSALYGLDKTYQFSGSVKSNRGRIVIYKNANKIILR